MKYFTFCFLVCLLVNVTALPNLPQKAHNLGLNTLVDLITKAGLAPTIADGGIFTIFAPSEAAFAKVPQTTLDALQQNITLLQEVLKYHVVQGTILSSDLFNDFELPSLAPYKKIRINMYKNNTVITATGSQVIQPDNMASNGVIHIIDTVMYPLPTESFIQYAALQARFSQLIYNAIRADLQTVVTGDGPFTVFAPTDKAFYALPPGYMNKIFLNQTLSSELILYHILDNTVYSAGLADGMMLSTAADNRNLTVHINSKGVMINNATVTEADHTVTNGVVHVIDTVLIPKNLIHV